MGEPPRIIQTWKGQRAPADSVKITGFVINYNEPDETEAALRSLGWCREVLLIDKSSDDFDPGRYRRWADRIIQVPWSPIVEDTRQFALDQCGEDWVIFLDADELVTRELADWIGEFLGTDMANWDGVWIPRKNYRFGLFSTEQFDWPQAHVRLVRRSAVSLSNAVHSRPLVADGRAHPGPKDQERAAMVHLSYPSFSDYLEKANRYTDLTEREPIDPHVSIFDAVRARIDWAEARAQGKAQTEFDAVTHALRAFYDTVLLFKDRIHHIRGEGASVAEQYAAERARVLSAFESESR